MLKSIQHWKCIVCVCLVYLIVSFLFFNALKLGFLFCHFAKMISLAVPVTCMCKIQWTLFGAYLIASLCGLDAVGHLLLMPHLPFSFRTLHWFLQCSDHPVSVFYVIDSSLNAGVPQGSSGPTDFLCDFPWVNCAFKVSAITHFLNVG